MAWTDLARVKRYLALDAADTTDDAVISEGIAAAQVLAVNARRQSGYVDSVTPPDDACAEGVTRWAALLYQARGTGEGFAGFVDAGQTIGTPYYEQRRTILLMLGCPRPTIDGMTTTPTPDPADGLPAGGLTGQSLVKASSADFDVKWDTPPGPTAGRWAYAGTSFVVDPGLGGIGIDTSGGSAQRGLAMSARDADGVGPRQLGRLLAGDTMILSNPLTDGWARYIITEAPTANDAGLPTEWWSFTADRTDTGGSTQPPPLGTIIIAHFTLAAGGA